MSQAFDRMRGHGFPKEQELQSLLRSASPHEGPWPTISIWHGSADQTVASVNATQISAQWRGVHELASVPTHIDSVDGHEHRAWRELDGRMLIEEYLIAGMGHGTPIAMTGPRRCGIARPFMLDVGISSTFHIARAWGLAEAVPAHSSAIDVPAIADLFSGALSANASRQPDVGIVDHVSQADARLGISLPSSSDGGSLPSVPPVAGVRKVIEDALRAAGLMR